MNTTDKLHCMLDDRGVKWWPSDDRRLEDSITHWKVEHIKWTAFDTDGKLCLNAWIDEPLTPEQAIAATLGNTCETCPQMDNPDSFIRHLMEFKPIIHCQDCRFEIHNECSRPDEWEDELWFPVEPDGFCKWGEER